MKELNAQEAYDLMQADPEYIYLDVRSVPEFDAGHPMRAINIPIMHFTPGTGMSSNQDFAAVVQAALAKDAKLVIGCKTGGRSARACEEMSQMGYTNVANVRGGFIGQMDSLGQVSEPGWSMRNLPTCVECGPDDCYEALAARSTKG
jgi:rhodanese-related sulfurtransferase